MMNKNGTMKAGVQMKSTILSVIALLLCLTLCACSGDQSVAAPSNEPTSAPSQTDASSQYVEPSPDSDSEPTAPPTPAEPEEKEAEYPFEDNDGRIHHQIYINGELVDTDHDAYTYPDEPKGAYYPIVEILEYLSVECLFDEHLEALTTRVNGQVITCKSDNSDIAIGKTTLGGTAPEYIDGCFYVPSYTFMHLLDAVVDFTADRSGVTIKTDMAIDTADSGTAGLSLSSEAIPGLGEALYTGAQACPSCGGTGRSICTSCSGTGGTTQYIQVRDPISGSYTMQSSRAFCSRCGGSGRSTCPTCGGTGSR
jgi:hypothetical protein